MAKKFTVSDGKMVLILQPAEKGWYSVTCPFDPALNTQAKTIEEAFVMAYDAQKCLNVARKKLSNALRTAEKRHTEVNPFTARGICLQSNVPRPRGR